MAVIFVFCDQTELKEWIAELCKAKGLGILCLGNMNNWEVVPLDALGARDLGFQCFLFSNQRSVAVGLPINDVRPREWGWVTVRPGGVKVIDTKSVLLPSEMHGEPYESDTADPEKWVQWLKKKLRPNVYHGVRGRNEITNGESVYRSIWYTTMARKLFDNGVVWKQIPTDSSVFEPM